nr:hypothetical protein [Tanacetum cinerariifolium]
EKGNDFDVNNSLDPFELYPLLNKKKNVEEKMDKSNGTVSIPFPLGFQKLSVIRSLWVIMKAAGLEMKKGNRFLLGQGKATR